MYWYIITDDTMQDTMPMEKYVEVIYKPISEDSELVTKTDLGKYNLKFNKQLV